MAESSRLAVESQGRIFIPDLLDRRINEKLMNTYVYSNPLLPPKLVDGLRLFIGAIEGSPYRPVTEVGQLLWNAQRDATELATDHKVTPQQALDRGTAQVQHELDQLLNPPRGRAIDFRWLARKHSICCPCSSPPAIAVFKWDTDTRVRGVRFLNRRRPPPSLAGDGVVEGTISPLFRSH